MSIEKYSCKGSMFAREIQHPADKFQFIDEFAPHPKPSLGGRGTTASAVVDEGRFLTFTA